MRFKDRLDAGRSLAGRLLAYKAQDVLVLGLARGGIPVASEVAKALEAGLDVVVARKLGAPGHPEFGFGAIAPGVRVLDAESVAVLGLDAAAIQRVEERERAELERRLGRFRGNRPPPRIRGRTVLVVDDGIATGVTAKAALRSVRAQHPSRLVYASPVGPPSAVRDLQAEADDVVVLERPEPLGSVGHWYEDFTQTEDEDVLRILAEVARKTKRTEERFSAGEGEKAIAATLLLPPGPRGLVVFAHGSGSNRGSPRNLAVAQEFNKRGLATVLVDLLTAEEADLDEQTRQHRFDIPLLARRVQATLAWAGSDPRLANLGLGLYGASTGAAAALVAAANEPRVKAVVSRGGRPDLAGPELPRVRAATLLVVGSRDPEVLRLNEAARDNLSTTVRLHVVPGATHLFEEAGAMEQVSQAAGDWFLHHLASERRPARPPRPAADAPSRRLDEEGLDELLRRIGDARIVMLGEATHGTHDFYAWRSRITMRLVREKGFGFIGVEGDWPDCFRINRWIKGDHRIQGDADAVLQEFNRWPTWMWANQDIASLLRDLRKHNQTAPAKVGFYGLDVYSLHESLQALLRHLSDRDPQAHQAALRAVACFEPYGNEPSRYALDAGIVPEGCLDEVVDLLAATRRLAHRLPDGALESSLDANLNAKVVQNAERYYRSMLEGGAASWNVRDRHMMESLEALLDHHGPSSKAIVWAHNTHVGDARATDMLQAGMVNIGQLARERFGGAAFLVGFSTYEGSVIAGRSWGAPMRRMRVPPAKAGSLEAHLHESGDRLLFSEELPDRRIGHRAIGVVYHPGAEGCNYVPTQPRQRYDALLHIDRTRALDSLHAVVDETQLPETYPSGV